MKNLFKKRTFQSLFTIFAFTVSAMVVSSCSDDDGDDMPITEPVSIVDIVVSNEDFSVLEAALIKADLVETLSGDGPFTVFAPTNDAFAAAGITDLDDYTAEELTPILLYHVLGAEAMAASLSDGQAVTTLSNSNMFYLSINANGVFINGKTEVTEADIDASNGVIHIIDETLVPPMQDIVEIAVAAGYSRLAEALTEANLVTTLQGDGPFTVFAPTNEAFDALYSTLGVNGPAEIDDDVLAAVLTYHVVPGRVFSTDLSDGLMPETVQTGTITINVGSGVTITDMDPDFEDANVTSTDILGTNGVVHVIDGILLPVNL